MKDIRFGLDFNSSARRMVIKYNLEMYYWYSKPNSYRHVGKVCDYHI